MLLLLDRVEIRKFNRNYFWASNGEFEAIAAFTEEESALLWV